MERFHLSWAQLDGEGVSSMSSQEKLGGDAPGKTPGAEFTLRSLRVFIAVEETGSVNGAAVQLGGSPSGVSQQISSLERAVGAKLFDRQARPVRLTPAGQVLRGHARRILEAVADARADLAELNLATLPRLALAVIDDLDASLTPVLVSDLQTRFRNCFVTTYSGRSDLVTEKLERRECDIAVSAILPRDTERFQAFPILREAYVLVSGKGAIDPTKDVREQLAALPFVQYSDAIPIGRAVARHLDRVRFDVPRHFAFEASRSVFAMVAKTNGWTLTTPLNVLDAERFVPELDVHPMPFPSLSRQVHLSARVEELGRLPEHMAGECRRRTEEFIIPRFASIAPILAGAVETMRP